MLVDVITLTTPLCKNRVIYREHGKHEYVPQTPSVEKITSMEVEPVFPRNDVRIDNMAGRFLTPFTSSMADKVTFNGRRKSHRYIFHVDGTLTLCKDALHFKGCTSLRAIERIKHDIGLSDSASRVYMVLLTGNLGCMVDVRFNCFIEHFFAYNYGGCFFPRYRVIDLHPVIYLEIHKWKKGKFPVEFHGNPPRRVLLTISHKGTVIFRLNWDKVLWTETLQHDSIEFCQWILNQIKDCC